MFAYILCTSRAQIQSLKSIEGMNEELNIPNGPFGLRENEGE